MSVQLKIDVRDKEVALVLRTLQGRMQDMTPVMREIGEIVRDSVMRNFREGRAPNRRPWRPSLRAILQRGQTLAFSSLLIGTTAETASAIALTRSMLRFQFPPHRDNC